MAQGEEKSANHQTPVDCFEEFAFEDVELADRYAADFGVEAIRAKGVAQALARHCDGRDYEAMTG
jgi:hypothetical protein